MAKTDERMRIIYISDVFFPDSGYSEVIYPKYWASFGHEVTVLTAELDRIPEELSSFFGKEGIEERDKEFTLKYGVRVIRVPLLAFKSGRAIYHSSVFETLRKMRPDIVFVGGNDTLIGIQLTKRYPKEKYGLVMDSHMLEMASRNPLRTLFRAYYKRFITPKIIKYDIPIIRVQDDPYVEKALGIPLDRAPYISFGSDLMLFHPDVNTRGKWREENRISEKAFVVLYAGKLDESKGGLFLANALLDKFDTKREIVFVIIGNSAGEKKEELDRILSESANRVLRFPTQKYEALAKYYQSADIALFPKQCSLSFFDVQACGLPVVFEDNNINKDRSNFHNAVTFKSGDMSDFRSKIEYMSALSDKEYKEYSDSAVNYIQKNYNYGEKAGEIVEIMKKEAGRKNK